MAKWYVAAKKADFNKIAKTFGISPVVARIIRNRDVIETEDIRKFLQGNKEDFYSPFLLADMEKAVEILRGKIKEQKRIRVIGDYDVDGICSAYLLSRGLKSCGALADVVIPHRIKDGYGLNESLIQDVFDEGIDTIVTCDNGIAAAETIQLAKSLGITIVITDHHEVPFVETKEGREEQLPIADAIVNPKRKDCEYPLKGICGATVAWKLVTALAEDMAIAHEKELIESLMPYAAIATVCDVMELLDENRILVKEGLKLLRKNPEPGIFALIQVNGLKKEMLSAYHLGFVLGPCLNATGRLDTAKKALELLESPDYTTAIQLAEELKELNESRKNMTSKGVEEAKEYIIENHLEKDRVLVIFLPDCHESLAGIIAGRIRELYTKPVFVFTRAEENIKGSARGIEAYSIYEELVKCREYLLKFGGHKLAAGLSMEEEKLEDFKKAINEQCTLTAEDMEEKVHIDVPMPLSYATEDFIRELGVLEPFGVGNPKPVFAVKDVLFLQAQRMGKKKDMGKFKILDDSGEIKEAILFGKMDEFDSYIKEKFSENALAQLYSKGTGKAESKEEVVLSVVYYPGLNQYMGKNTVQIILQDYQ